MSSVCILLPLSVFSRVDFCTWTCFSECMAGFRSIMYLDICGLGFFPCSPWQVSSVFCGPLLALIKWVEICWSRWLKAHNWDLLLLIYLWKKICCVICRSCNYLVPAVVMSEYLVEFSSLYGKCIIATQHQFFLLLLLLLKSLISQINWCEKFATKI